MVPENISIETGVMKMSFETSERSKGHPLRDQLRLILIAPTRQVDLTDANYIGALEVQKSLLWNGQYFVFTSS